jgi:hypothetical protein
MYSADLYGNLLPPASGAVEVHAANNGLAGKHKLRL